MIPQAHINAWRRAAPWPTDTQVEQDLILSRLIVEIAGHELLGPELAFRGGTCLNKLHLPEALRYSADLDYVRRTRSGIGPYMAALRESVTRIGLSERGYEQRDQMVHMIFDAEPTSGRGSIRVRIEINIREVESFEPNIELHYRVDSPWWDGEAKVTTFTIEELMATKLRTVYQRRKGRDLFDLWHVLQLLTPNPQRIIDGLHHYMGGRPFSFSDLSENLRDKLTHRDFIDDLTQLVARVPSTFDIVGAADLVMERLGVLLPGAPPLSEIQAGAWR